MNFTNYEEMAAMILFGIGFTTLLLHKNMIKKIIGFSMMDSAIYLFLAVKGYIAGRKAPIVVDGITSMEAYINPIPAGLVPAVAKTFGKASGACLLSAIVVLSIMILPSIVSVSVTALMLALTVRLYRQYHTLDIDEITALCRKEEET